MSLNFIKYFNVIEKKLSFFKIIINGIRIYTKQAQVPVMYTYARYLQLNNTRILYSTYMFLIRLLYVVEYEK